MSTDSLSTQGKHWMLYPVRSEQIKAAGNDDVDHAEWVIRVDGPPPPRPVKVVPEAEVERLRGLYEGRAREVDSVIAANRAEVERLREALADLADKHHRTLSNSRMHDPERQPDFRRCPCKTCRAAVAVLNGEARS